MINEQITAAMQTWAQHADAAQLAAGPHPADLGGLATVADAAADLALSPWLVYLVDIAAHDIEPADDQLRRRIDRAVVDGFAHHDRVSSYASAAARLLIYPGLAHRLGRALEVALLARAEQATSPTADSASAAVGATAAEAVLHLSTTGTLRPHRLLAYLTDLADTIGTMPAELCVRLPRMVGIAHEHFADDDLLTILEQLLTIPDAEPDAVFELALASLRRALNANDLAALMPALVEARDGFAATEAGAEARHDARAYGAAIDAIVAFDRSDQGPFHDAVARLDAAVTQHHAWLSGMHSPPWRWARGQAEAAWLQLSTSMVAAAQSGRDACWYHPQRAIAGLLDAYQAARTFTAWTARTGEVCGVEVLIRPAVESAFLRDANRLALLDHALASDAAFSDDGAAQDLHEAVHRALNRGSAQPVASKEDGGDAGKVLARLPAILTRLGVRDAADIAVQLHPDLLGRLETLLWNEEVASSATGNVKLDRLYEKLTNELSSSSDWIHEIAGPFKILLRQTLLYLDSRFDIGATMSGERTAFLRVKPDADPAKERPLHQDYYEWLTQGPIHNAVFAEVIDRGGGRADIVVRFANASFCVECKRELRDASPEALRAYAGQPSAYTATDAAFGILLVLDLTGHPTGAPDLFSSVWIEPVQRAPEEQPRQIIVARLPGNRPAPSATAAPPRAM
jgi:hypothetical protein